MRVSKIVSWSRARFASAVLAGLTLLLSPRLSAQGQAPGERILPTHGTVISGYGTVGFAIVTEGENENRFNAAISPILLFQFLDRVLFEAEIEFELEEGVTEVGLEYAQLDYVVNDNLILVGGKFLVPFGVFIDRLHPTWINKFPPSPPIFGHGAGSLGEPLIPILSDVGIMAKAVTRSGPWQLDLNAYVTQGPAGEVHEGEEGMEGHGAVEVEFPGSSEDNNKNKMVGGRLDVAHQQHAELNLSAFTGKYDDEGDLRFTGYNVAGLARWAGLELRGEYVQTRQEIEEMPEEVVTLRRHGYYAQAAYRIGPWEPVVRLAQIFDSKIVEEGEIEAEGAWQLGLGLDYWFSPSIAIMAGYEINNEKGIELKNNRFLIHWAFGF